MFKDLRWKGVITLFLGLVSTHFLFDFIPLIYRPKEVWLYDDLIYNYLTNILYWSGFALFIGLYVRSMNKLIIIESPAKQWGMLFVPFYNAILFMMAGSNIPKRKTKSILFGVFFLLWQLDLFFPWTLFHSTFDASTYNESSSNRLFEEVIGMIASTGMVVTWLIYVFSLNGENKWNEPPQLQTAHHRFIIRDLSRGVGPEQPVKWIILIPVLFAFTFIAESKIDLLMLNYINGYHHDSYIYMEMNDENFYLFIWAALLRTTAIISLAVLSYHVFRMLYGLNVGEAPSAGLGAGGWFIPGFQTYWNYAVFVIWRKHFEKGTKDLALTSADNPDKRILRFTAIIFLIYMLRPVFYWLFNMYIQQVHYRENDGVLMRYYKGYLQEVLSIFWAPNAATMFMTIALTAYILHVCELAGGLKKAAFKKMVAMGEASPDAVRF